MIANALIIDNMGLLVGLAYFRVILELVAYQRTGKGLGEFMGAHLHSSKQALHHIGLILACGFIFFFHLS